MAINYESRIGVDFDSALDSLISIYEPTILGNYAENGYYIEKERIDVDFCYDNRNFFLLTFIDAENIYNWLITSVVIDEKGNYLYLEYCND